MSSGNVGIGTTSPKALSGQKSLSINASVPRIDFKVGDVFKHHILAEAEYMSIGADADNNQSNSRVIIEADNAVVARFDSDGIKFGAATAAANALDNYEEGTWTPVPKFGSTSGSTVSASGQYTKIGSFVNAVCFFGVSSLNGGSGDFTITGLPFVSANITAISIRPHNISYSGMIVGDINSNTTTIRLYVLNESGGFAELSSSAVTTTAFISISTSYFTNA